MDVTDEDASLSSHRSSSHSGALLLAQIWFHLIYLSVGEEEKYNSSFVHGCMSIM